jgi:hypothetical protein
MDSSRRSVSAMSVRTTASSARADVRHDALRSAAAVREKNVNGIAVGGILHPVNGYRGELERRGVVPTDHAKRNVAAMREKQKEIQARRELEEAAAKTEAFKLKKFTGVESRVKEMISSVRVLVVTASHLRAAAPVCLNVAVDE